MTEPTPSPEPVPKWPGPFMAGVAALLALGTVWFITKDDDGSRNDDVVLTPRDEEDPVVEDTDLFVLEYLEGTEGWATVCEELADIPTGDEDALRDLSIDAFEEGYGDLSPAGEDELWRMIQDC